FPAAAPAAAPPESRDAPPVSPTVSLPAEAAAEEIGDGDEALVARVTAQLFDGAPALGVEVAASGGVVTLRGEVADEEAEGRFVRDAEQVEGVKAVQSELVTSEPGAAS
ncbi:MAG: BON domain-containing protein, partial [Solirubrobacterales bacterium]|nr:BON domain-containing protein [Solirubrobacterales bacterium]